ncbi:MAG: 23S rRNA (uracil(1939)-C(5))-methyltransferase RlmD [Gammaproteobacteria bacterium]|nr:23S rRNA (uracil(1939)-C(5))-methyltransferase RlmD [Gammaproteobacteria bacterium]
MARRGRRKRKNLPADAVELTVDRISHEGRGIASNNGKVAFIDGALPGEQVRARYVDSRASFDEMVVEEVLVPSPDRVSPRCSYFGTCGGCSLQHLAPDAQISLKRGFLLDQLCHASGIEPDSFPLLENQCGEAFHYRRKARLAVRYVSKKGGALVGFREKHSTFITDMTTCHVLERQIAELLVPLRELVNSLDAKMSIPQFEVASGLNKVNTPTVALVMRHLEALSQSDLDQLLEFAQRQNCDFYLQPKGADSIHKVWPVDEKERLYYLLPEFDLEMQFHPVDFVQVNHDINRKAVGLALQLLELQPDDEVLDLFCGLGNFTLPMSRACKLVIGVEGSEIMVKRAEENAAHNGIDNVSFDAADLYSLTGDEFWYKRKYDKVLLDPPRSGALEVIDWLAQSGASRIVYISCNPATLARDTARLLSKGYRLCCAGVMDMFPHTAHVESIAQFERKN